MQSFLRAQFIEEALLKTHTFRENNEDKQNPTEILNKKQFCHFLSILIYFTILNDFLNELAL